MTNNTAMTDDQPMPAAGAASEEQGRWTMRWLRRQDPGAQPVAVLIDSEHVPQPADGEPPAGEPEEASSPFAPTEDAPGVPDPASLESERRQLIELLIYAWDRARSPGVWERLAAGLADIGVQVLRPDGEPFDPNAHEVGGTEHTDDPAKIDTVAETEVAGFADRGALIREPVVVVYRSDPGAG